MQSAWHISWPRVPGLNQRYLFLLLLLYYYNYCYHTPYTPHRGGRLWDSERRCVKKNAENQRTPGIVLYWSGNWGSQRWSNLPKLIKAGKGRAEVGATTLQSGIGYRVWVTLCTCSSSHHPVSSSISLPPPHLAKFPPTADTQRTFAECKPCPSDLLNSRFLHRPTLSPLVRYCRALVP